MPKEITEKRRGRRALRQSLKAEDGFSKTTKIATCDCGKRARLLNVHPGEFLREEFMKPLRLTPAIMAAAIPRHPEFPELDIAEIIRDLVEAEDDSFLDIHMALALDRYFGLRPGYFWRVQSAYDVRVVLADEAQWLRRVKPRPRSSSGNKRKSTSRKLRTATVP